MFKILVTGDRNWTDRATIYRVLEPYKLMDEVTLIEGEADGADTIAKETAEHFGWEVDPYKAEWTVYGRAAGPIRNKKMVEQNPDIVFAFHPDIHNSKGTKSCVRMAKDFGLPVILIQPSPQDL